MVCGKYQTYRILRHRMFRLDTSKLFMAESLKRQLHKLPKMSQERRTAKSQPNFASTLNNAP